MVRKRTTLLDQSVLMLFFVALMGYMPTARNSDRLVWIGALGLLLVRVLWLVARREVHFMMDINLFCYILLFLWGMLSCFWSVKIQDFSNYISTSFPAVVCAVFCITAMIGQRIEANQCIALLIWAGVIAGVRYCLYTDWSGLSSEYYMRGTFGRLLDDVTNYNNYTTIICMPCVLAFYFAIVDNQRKFYIPAIILLTILLIGGSRKNIIVTPIIALLFTFFAGNGTEKLKKIILLILLLVAGLYLLMTVPVLEQIKKAMLGMIGGFWEDSETQVDESTLERMYLMEQGIQVWKEHPFLGVGWNNYRYYNDAQRYAHNNYVEMLASLGIVGFLLYYAIFLRITYILCAGFSQRRIRKEDILLLGFSLNMLITEMGSITPYFKERLILMLVVFYWHSYTTKRKVYQFALK